MRLIKLEILNLASLDRQGGEVINFEEGVLKDSTIFSIVGPTGSGKSTILDAICLALYNRAPRYPRIKGQKGLKIEIYGTPDEGEKNRPVPTDNRNILTRGKKYAYSRLTFRANDGSIYRAEWSVQRKTKNIEEPVTHLFKITSVNGQIQEEQADWDAIPQIIGLGYDQFLRTVLIAQGSFANFLTSSEKDRYELLEKLIGCEELYTNIADKIKLKKDEATQAYNLLAANLSAFEQDIIKDPAELQALTDRIKELEDEESKAKAELTKLAEYLNWYTTEDRFADNIGKFEKAYAEARLNLEAIKQNVERLELHDKTLTAVGYYKEMKTAVDNVQAYATKLKGLDSQTTTLQTTLQQENTTLVALKASAQEAGLQLSTQKPHIDRARVIKGELAVAKRSVAEKTRAEADAKTMFDKAVKAVDDNAKAIAKAQGETVTASDDLSKLKSSVASKTAVLQSDVKNAADLYTSENDKAEAVDAVALQNAKSSAEKKQTDIKNAIRVRKALADNATSQRKNAEKSGELTQQNKDIDAEIATLTIDALSRELETLNKTYTLMTSENWQEHRASLADGEPCPLCGAVHHPYADDSAYIPVANELKNLIDGKQEELKQQTARKEDLNKKKSGNDGQLKTLAESAVTLREGHEKLVAEWAEIHQAYPDWEEDVQALLDRQTAIDAEVPVAQKSLDEYNKLVKKVGTLRKEKERAEKSLADYKQQSDLEVKEAEKKLTDAQTRLQTEQGKTENLSLQRADKLNAHEQAKQALAIAKTDVEAKKTAITNEIGDKDPDAFEQELQKAKIAADDAVTKKAEDIGKIQGDIKALQSTSETIAKAKADEQTRLDDNTHKLNEWLLAYNASPDNAVQLTTDDITLLYSATDDWEAIRKLQQQRTATFTSAETTLNNEKQSQLDHQQSKPEQEKDTLLARKAELEGKSNNELVEAKARKQRHDTAKQQAGSLGVQKEAAEQLKQEWESISSAIGGADGKMLRKIAQCYTLRFLIEHANAEIRKFNSRYELQQVKNSLGIRVIDHDRADDVRDVTSLSGGETFIVSLGLALGLSALSSRNISFENLFIDEGFGTLDPDALDSVIDSLSMLQSSQGKKVGVISHTNTMVERITTQIRIIKNGHTGSSYIEIYPK